MVPIDCRRVNVMTSRTVVAAPLKRAPPDFTTLDCPAAKQRVAQLAALGFADDTIAVLTGWHRNDVRRALGNACPSP
jgi:hypothetical protein